MRSLAALAVLALSFGDARVVFPFSQILQAPDLVSGKASFSCQNDCKVYTDRDTNQLVITSNGHDVTNFDLIVGGNPYAPVGLTLAAGCYSVENRGLVNPEFVLYIVDKYALNFDEPVYVPSETVGVTVNGTNRYFTVLSSFNGIEFSGFQGVFPKGGYPHIYSTGFDAIDDATCHPAYQARTQASALLSRPTIASAVITVDFGFVGSHNVSLNKANMNNLWKAEGASTVYMSPGYVGCAPHYGQYYSKLDQVKDENETFINGLGFEAKWVAQSSDEPLRIKLGGHELNIYGTNYYKKKFDSSKNGTFAISWVRSTPQSCFMLQLDWDINDDPETTTTRGFDPQPTTTPFLSLTTTTKPPAIADSYCSCAVDKFGLPDGWESTEIWLDVVIILDASEAMGAESLEDAATLIESLIGDDDYDVLITDTRESFYTRIGVIEMSDTAEVLFNLNMTKYDTIANKVQVAKGVKKIDVMHAFTSASDMFAQGLLSKPDRANTRQVIYYLTDSDATINSTLLNDFKQHGTIIVEQFVKKGEGEKGLSKLASDGYYFKTNERNPIQTFCKANCFCAPDRTPYSGNSTDAAVIAGGGCFHAPTTGLQFGKAEKECTNNRNGELASVHDQAKAAFLNDLVSTATNKNSYFWIGYSKESDGVWRWEDQSSDPYTNWDVDEPSAASVSKCAYVDQSQENLPWGAGNCQIVFPYVCEYAPCAVGNKNC